MDKSFSCNFDNEKELKNLNTNELSVWRLGKTEGQSNNLFELVLKGKKKATSYLFKDKNDLDPSKFSILTNWDGSQRVLIQTTDVTVLPFKLVTRDHAKKRGRGT